MDDPTDMALGISAAVGLAICGICVVVNAWRSSRMPRLKESRSDPDLENLQDLVAESLPTHK
jgi:hypothetical protein